MPNGDSPEETYTPRPHRSSESNLRDYLEARINALEAQHDEYVRATDKLSAERDRRLDDRFTGQETATAAALAAAEKATSTAFTASEKAISKAEMGSQATIAAQAKEIIDLRSRLDIGPPSLSILQTRSDEAMGRTAGSLDTRSLIFALIGASGVILGAVAFLTR